MKSDGTIIFSKDAVVANNWGQRAPTENLRKETVTPVDMQKRFSQRLRKKQFGDLTDMGGEAMMEIYQNQQSSETATTFRVGQEVPV